MDIRELTGTANRAWLPFSRLMRLALRTSRLSLLRRKAAERSRSSRKKPMTAAPVGFN